MKALERIKTGKGETSGRLLRVSANAKNVVKIRQRQCKEAIMGK